MEYIIPEDKDFITLQQTIVSLPDKSNVEQVINREKSAANNIISHSIDFTREMRGVISEICEASSYRTYSDMNGTLNFIINSKEESEVIVKIKYFINDFRLKWSTRLTVNINDDGKTAEMEGFLVVDNQTGFSYDNVDLGFAIFELPSASISLDQYPPMNEQQVYFQEAEEVNMPQQQIRKRTQRLKNLML